MGKIFHTNNYQKRDGVATPMLNKNWLKTKIVIRENKDIIYWYKGQSIKKR